MVRDLAERSLCSLFSPAEVKAVFWWVFGEFVHILLDVKGLFMHLSWIHGVTMP